MKIKVPGFEASETLCALIRSSIKEFCNTNNLRPYFHELPNVLLPFKNVVLTVRQERCNLEYPGKGAEAHFYAIVAGVVFQEGSHWFLLFWPTIVSLEKERSWFMVDLTAVEGLLAVGFYESILKNLIKRALFNAWQAEEATLDKFRRKPVVF